LTASKEEKIFVGNGVSPGLALGQALRLDSHDRAILRVKIADDAIDAELQRFHRALEISRNQLIKLKENLEAKVGIEHSFILDVHLLMLEDRHLACQIEATIRKAHCNAEWALRLSSDRIWRAYASMEDEYFRERGNDVENVVERILSNLAGDEPLDWTTFPEDLIIVSRNFNPSAFASLDLTKLKGLALESGGRTSHTAIIARSLRIPAVMGVPRLCSFVSSGDIFFIDGDEGTVIQNPCADRREHIRTGLAESGMAVRQTAVEKSAPAIAKDGVKISLLANIDVPNEVVTAQQAGAEGIGLFRSEFLFYGNPRGFPSVEEQTETYRTIARAMHPYPVTVRTLDAGGDKAMPGVKLISQPNPNMGLRGIRLSLKGKTQFCDQIEAILRARSAGVLEMVLPMITGVEEIRQVRALIRETERRIAGAHSGQQNPLPLGVMIEVPAAVVSLEAIANETDFLCVGTNDLIQYLLAVDRANPQVAYLYQPLHPSVLYCLKRIADLSNSLNKPARICGEMSANPIFAMLLIGMGFKQLSMNGLSISTVRRIILDISTDACRRIAERAMQFLTASETAEYLIESVGSLTQTDLSPYIKEVRAPSGPAALSYAL
jgi:phosphotransferase system enzyme I (PtsI)